jgi:hypothetical protein
MITKSRLFMMCGLALSLAGGCVGLDEEDLGEATQELSVSSWSAPARVGADLQEAYRSGQVATLNGVAYMVHSGRCGSWSCGGSGPSKELWWTQRTATTGWTNDIKIPNQLSAHKVSLAAFNGYLYMVHTGSDDGSTSLWISRFSPSTQQWSTNYQIAYSSLGGPPAIAAFGGVLRVVGVSPADGKLWTATMSTGEVFSTATPMSGQYSVSRPSAAVFNNRLYVAHRAGSTNTIVYNSFNGTSWTYDSVIYAGPAGAAIEGTEPVIAAYDGYLHLIHRRPGSNYVWWTYFNGTSWPGEVTLNTLTSTYDPSLALGPNGLELVTTTDVTWNGIVETRKLYTSRYTSPYLPPIDPPPCCIGL